MPEIGRQRRLFDMDGDMRPVSTWCRRRRPEADTKDPPIVCIATQERTFRCDAGSGAKRGGYGIGVAPAMT